MSQLKAASPGLPFVSFLYHQNNFEVPTLINIFKQKFADFALVQPTLCPMKDYYSKEMGNPQDLQRLSLIGLKPRAREDFVSHKHWAQNLEEYYKQNDRRLLNCDTGMLTKENFILATGKNFTHRIYLADGVYADLTLMYQGQSFANFPWTYPDYTSPDMLNFFNWAREFLIISSR